MTDNLTRSAADGDASPAERVAMLGPMLADTDPRVRKSAVVALGRMSCSEATAALCGMLDDADEGVRVLTCQALGRAADPASVPTLVAHAHDPSAKVRAGMLWAFANVAAHGRGGGALDEEGRAALFTPIVVLAFDPDDGVRADAAAVLGTLRDRRSTDALVVLLEDACPRVRANACASLALTDDDAGLEALLGVLEGDEAEPIVLVSALDGLSRRAERGSVAPETTAAARAVAVACRWAEGNPADEEQGAGVAAGGEGGDESTAADVRATAVWALGMLVELEEPWRADVRARLERALESPHVWTVRYAVEALARQRDEAARATLLSFRGRLGPSLDPEVAVVLEQALATFDGVR